MSDQPYSDKAMHAATGSNVRPCHPTPGLARVFMALDAAHDREALGLDASVCARVFLNEIVATIQGRWGGSDGVGDEWAAWLVSEFTKPDPPTSQHVDDDPERSMQENRVDIP